MREYRPKKNKWKFPDLGAVPYAVRFEIIQDIPVQCARSGFTVDKLLGFYKIKKSTYYGWLDENGTLKPPVERKVTNPRKILGSEVQAVLNYRLSHKDVGYRKLCWQMIDENIAYLTESAVYDILSKHNMLYGWAAAQAEGTAKEYKNKPQYPHHHWHTDIAYIKIQGIFYFLIMMLDGYSRYLLGWELMTDMLGTSVESFVQRIKEKYPNAKPMLIHDNGGQFVSLDFKKLVTALEIQSVRTRRNHPQTNGKIERMNGTVKSEAIRPGAPTDYLEALEILNQYEYTYNHQRLHAGINFLRPADMFFGRKNKVLRERNEKMTMGLQLRKEFNKNESARLN